MVALQLGCAYPRPLIELVQREATAVDWLKASRRDLLATELTISRQLRPGVMHTLGRVVSPNALLPSDQWDALNDIIEGAGAPHIALPFDLRPEDWDVPLDRAMQTGEQIRGLLSRLIALVRGLQRWLCVPLLLENVIYDGVRGPLRLCVQPEVIWQMVEECGIGMLLDLHNIRSTAYHLGIDVRAYLRSLPLHAVREIHLAESRHSLCDQHRSRAMLAENYRLLAWLLDFVQPEIITLECAVYSMQCGSISALESIERAKHVEPLRELCVNG